MGRYSSLCIFLITLALFENIVAAPLEGGDGGEASNSGEESSGAEGSGSSRRGSRMKNFRDKMGQKMSSFGSKLTTPFVTSWDNVMLSVTGSEKGILKTKNDGFKLSYGFYPKSSLKNNTTVGVDAAFTFAQADMRDPNRNDAAVTFKLRGDNDKVYTLLFANDNHAYQFMGQISVSHLLK